jgi:hypothetical protein
MAMETSLACSSAAAAALSAASFFSLSALPALHVRRPRRVCHTRRPLLGARGFLAFGASSSAILFGGMVVEEKRRSCNCGGFRRGKWVYAVHFGGKQN